jgi:hypothetical protein
MPASLLYAPPHPISLPSMDGRMIWPCTEHISAAPIFFFPEKCEFDSPRVRAGTTSICERVSL